MASAPARFSTITGWPRAACSRSASTRATLSAWLPGPSGTTRLIGLLGYAWGKPSPQTARHRIAVADLRTREVMTPSRENDRSGVGPLSPPRHRASRHGTGEYHTGGAGLNAELPARTTRA